MPPGQFLNLAGPADHMGKTAQFIPASSFSICSRATRWPGGLAWVLGVVLNKDVGVPVEIQAVVDYITAKQYINQHTDLIEPTAIGLLSSLFN